MNKAIQNASFLWLLCLFVACAHAQVLSNKDSVDINIARLNSLLLLFEFIRDYPDLLAGLIVHHCQQGHLSCLAFDGDGEVL
jgi:hypothetical protein